MRIHRSLATLTTLWALNSSAEAGTVRVQGSTTVNPVVAKAAEILRAEQKLAITVDTTGGSSGGLTALAEGRAEVAMMSRPLLPEDHERYPGKDFRPLELGADAVVLAVSKDVWDGGVRALSREQVQGIYDGTVKNWKDLGGPDRRIVFFNKEPGRGTWEVFAHWLYGDPKKAPLVAHLEVGSNEEGRAKAASTRGAITQLSAAWADGKSVFPLSVRAAEGVVIEPTTANVGNGRYPMARPLLVVTAGAPAGDVAKVLDFLLSARGQQLVREAGYVPLAELGKAPEKERRAR